MYCDSCGAKNKENAPFCVYCGNKLELPPETPQHPPVGDQQVPRQQNVVYSTPSQSNVIDEIPPEPSDHMTIAIVSLVISILSIFCMCAGFISLGFSIAGIVNANKVRDHYRLGYYDSAEAASKRALNFSVAGIVIAIVLTIVVFFFYVLMEEETYYY